MITLPPNTAVNLGKQSRPPKFRGVGADWKSKGHRIDAGRSHIENPRFAGVFLVAPKPLSNSS